ncbi:MAG: ArsR family transcriptional regulator [Candidatus Neomarinimicrobiota bacterium]|nr:MAG: ArsR family transcriptional regulator [Candidatus Neomarinimicrobiota bacterium]
MHRYQKVHKALSDFNRVRILHLLAVRPLCVCEITDILGFATSTVSQHLSLLRDAGLVESSKDGKWVDYRLPDHPAPGIRTMLDLTLNSDLDEATIRQDRERIKSVDRDAICRT